MKLFEKLFEVYYHWRGKTNLLHKYRYVNEVNKILEEYETRRILNGGPDEYLAKCRQSLVNKQNEINENSKFIEFLKNL